MAMATCPTRTMLSCILHMLRFASSAFEVLSPWRDSGFRRVSWPDLRRDPHQKKAEFRPMEDRPMSCLFLRKIGHLDIAMVGPVNVIWSARIGNELGVSHQALCVGSIPSPASK